MFRLDIKAALLREDEEVAVAVAKRPLSHRFIPCKDVDRKTLSQGWITIAADGLQALNEVGLAATRGDIEWVPRQLRRAKVDFRIEGQEARLELSRRVSAKMI